MTEIKIVLVRQMIKLTNYQNCIILKRDPKVSSEGKGGEIIKEIAMSQK